MKLDRPRVRIALLLVFFSMLCACRPTSEAVDTANPVPQLILLDVPDALVVDVEQPIARGSTEGDVAILIEEQRSAIAGANDRFHAIRLTRLCQRRLIAGEVEACDFN